jgi:hypothetical protein
MRSALIFASILLMFTSFIYAQDSVRNMVDTELAFAAKAAKDGSKAAFIEYLSDDSIIFQPDRTNGKEFWEKAKASDSMLSWFPVYADISANGTVGYTTGPWEFRQKKDDEPVAFGDFITIWEKRGENYKAVVDIGVSHEKSGVTNSGNVASPQIDPKAAENKGYAGDAATAFYELLGLGMTEKAYKQFADDDIRLYRDGNQPAIGKKDAVKLAGKSKLKITKRISFYGTSDLAYVTNRYEIIKDKAATETGNFLQIWKFSGGKWKIVVDVFAALPKS